MITDDLKHLPIDDCLPIVADQMKERMKWVWNEDLSSAYEMAKAESAVFQQYSEM